MKRHRIGFIVSSIFSALLLLVFSVPAHATHTTQTRDTTLYTFDASAKTINVSGIPNLSHVSRIVNERHQVLLYDVESGDHGGTEVNDLITLNFNSNTASYSDSDILLITYVLDAGHGDPVTTAFGDMLVSQLTPAIGVTFPYNVNASGVIAFPGNGGSVAFANNEAVISTGTESDGFGLLLTTNVLKYNPGQGGLARFTTVYPTGGAANSNQIHGIGNNLNGFFFGYDGTDFGVLHRTDGGAEIRTLTVTTASSTAENISITLDGLTDATVAVTASGDIATTAREIAEHSFAGLGTGWGAVAHGDVVAFLALQVRPQSGTYSLSSATTAVGGFTQASAGVVPNDMWTAQTAWNVDKLDGLGPSAMTLDKTKGNVYEIQYQWLGYGNIAFAIENPATGDFQTVHEIRYPNANTQPSINNPTLPMLAEVTNTGSTTNVSLKTSSMAGFIEGKENDFGVDFSVANILANATSTAELPILTIRNKQVYQGQVNQVRLKPRFVSFNSNVSGVANSTFRIYADAVIAGGATYTDVNATLSVVHFSDDATTFTLNEPSARLIQSFILGANETLIVSLNELPAKIAPRSTILITSQVSSGNANNTTAASIGWKELF